MESLSEQLEALNITKPSVAPGFKPQTIKLVSNHYRLQLAGKSLIHVYALKINPEVPADARGVIMGLVRANKQKMTTTFGVHVFSGMNLFAFKKITEPVIYETTFNKLNYVLDFTWARECDLNNLFAPNAKNLSEIMFLNICFKSIMRDLGYREFGRNAKFYDTQTKNIDYLDRHGLQILSGYLTSVDVYDGNVPRLLIDYSSRIVLSYNVWEYLLEGNPTDEEMIDKIVGRSVVSIYSNWRMYKVDDIDFTKTPASEFPSPDEKGQKRTYAQYFKSRYNIDIKDKKQPLLVNIDRKTQRITHLIPELVNMTGLTDDMRADFRVMKDVGDKTRLNPDVREDRIHRHAKLISEQAARKFGISLDIQGQALNGILLQPPRINLGKNDFVTPEKGNFILRDKFVLKPATFDNWLFVYKSQSKGEDDEADEFLAGMKRAASSFGITVKDPVWVGTKAANDKVFCDAITQNVKPNTQIVLIFIPVNAKRAYPNLKKLCCKTIGIPSQVVVQKSIYNKKTNKVDLSVCSKIILQMNVKIGNPIWSVQQPKNLPPKTMVIGADVFHNINKKRDSIVGLCATVDKAFTLFYSRISIQPPGRELMNNLASMVQGAIQRYFQINKELPENIVFFRDGVAKNQFPLVLEHEIPQILKAFKAINENYNPGFAEVIVTKRISDRFFEEVRGANNKSSIYNPLSGTVVADTATGSKGFDYFLVAQNVTQGTVTPTHYDVIRNSTTLSMDAFLELTFYMCFNYYNWMGAVRVPAPVQYAHKMAYLIGETFKDNVHANLQDKLYYL